MIRAVFFDAGNTLLHAHPSVVEVYARETERFGARVAPDEFARCFVPIFRDYVRRNRTVRDASDELDRAMWREILGCLHREIPALGSVPFEEWFAHLHAHFGEPGTWRLYPDVLPALRELKDRGYRLAIVSNWNQRLRRIADGLGLTPLVDAIVISCEAGVRKPHPQIFERALRAVGARPEETVHVGDVAEEDVAGARGAGLHAVLVERDRRLVDWGAEAVPVVRSMGEFLTWLRTAP